MDSVDWRTLTRYDGIASFAYVFTMRGMSKQRRKKTVPTKEASRVRAGVNLNVWLPPEIMEAFEAMRQTTGRSKTMELLFMMRKQLKEQGFWSPEPQEENE